MSTDSDLIHITDAALADSYTRAGFWMACKPGCHQCCIGVFPILKRAAETRARLSRNFPGNPTTGELFTEPHHEELFDDFANDEPCPVLDPITGTCDLYAARPIPCRTFGPPMPNDEGGLAVCELCFVGAPETEIARCAVDAHFLSVETEAVADHEVHTGSRGVTLIAFALSDA
jgi:Fe-S-cluster containining protein